MYHKVSHGESVSLFREIARGERVHTVSIHLVRGVAFHLSEHLQRATELLPLEAPQSSFHPSHAGPLRHQGITPDMAVDQELACCKAIATS